MWKSMVSTVHQEESFLCFDNVILIDVKKYSQMSDLRPICFSLLFYFFIFKLIGLLILFYSVSCFCTLGGCFSLFQTRIGS